MRRHQFLAAFVCVVLAGSAVRAAVLTAEATRAFRNHADEARQSFLGRVHVLPGGDDGERAALRASEVMAGPGQGDGILKVQNGLVHHWRSMTFIAGVTIDQALGVARAYHDYPNIYRPVVSASVLADANDVLRVRLRMKESAGGVSATLDIWSSVQYVRVDATHAYSVSNADEIREVKDAGAPSEHYLPAGRDSGYLWHAGTLTRFVEADGGVYVEMETLGLSRQFPPLLGWIIEPIARRIGRRSAETSLQEFARAVATRHAPGR